MKGFSRTTIVILVILVLVGFGSCGSYNKMVTKQENVETQWAKVETSYQRRVDLIPNLVSTVKGAANFERETYEAVVRARQQVVQVQSEVNEGNLNPENVAKYQQAQNNLSGAIRGFNLVVENYPQLRATQNFSELQAELAGTENRISTARNDFNTAAQEYNTYIKRFPQNIFSGLFGFEKKGYFSADAGAEDAPKVDFNNDTK
ncbi:MAG: LemA family protein [Bacteroidota bacterium]|nr:LemA family protein [Bacteroidota bacterium]